MGKIYLCCFCNIYFRWNVNCKIYIRKWKYSEKYEKQLSSNVVKCRIWVARGPTPPILERRRRRRPPLLYNSNVPSFVADLHCLGTLCVLIPPTVLMYSNTTIYYAYITSIVQVAPALLNKCSKCTGVKTYV